MATTSQSCVRASPARSVDLIYLDPPFNSQRSYNLIYKQLTGLPVPEQEEAFCDAWELDAEKEELIREMPQRMLEQGADDDVVVFWRAWIQALRGTQPELLAYIVYMTARLLEMRRILKPTGSIYLHCDSVVTHYIKVMMDAVFGHGNFRSEIIWKRTTAHNDAKRHYGDVSDRLLYYSKTQRYTFHRQYTAHDPAYVADKYRHTDSQGRRYRLDNLSSPSPRPNLTYDYKGFKPHANGWRYSLERMKQLDAEGRLEYPKKPGGRMQLRRYLNEMPGQPVSNLWDDIDPVNSQADERLGYPTQKPLALLDRIIKTSSNEGDVVFDPFCGCGTAIYSAHLNKRHWVGCDIAILSVRIVRDILLQRYGLREDEHYTVDGVPMSVDGAKELFEHDKRQFQHWVVELAGGFCNKKQSGDQGVDGRIYYETKDGLRSMVVSVKGGGLNPSYIREVRGTLEADISAEMAGFICLEKPTKGMLQEAAKAAMYNYLGIDYPRIQIRTVEQLLDGRGFDTPSRVRPLGWEKQTKLAI
jgi:DNA modification methylase